ncbi:hypothetical protein R1flu_026073 [Riccia fluitans]|uniref:Uncharacterized protein n=1 Tax=Riccia fluitans TaxID=41844 RepID=A0ABD1XEY1_9MARC
MYDLTYAGSDEVVREEVSDLSNHFLEPGISTDHENRRRTMRKTESSTAPVRGREGFEVQTPFFPGRIQNIALRHVVLLKFVRVEHSDGSLFADHSFAHGNEVFSVVSLPIHENAFALKNTETHRYISCKEGGKPVRAIVMGGTWG